MSESKLMSVMCSRFRLVSPLRVRRLRREVRERKPLLLRLSLIGRSPCTISLLEPLSIRILFPSSGSHLHTRVCPSLPCMHGHLLCSTPPLIPRNLFHTVARHATQRVGTAPLLKWKRLRTRCKLTPALTWSPPSRLEC
jgi:hypothetical protein